MAWTVGRQQKASFGVPVGTSLLNLGTTDTSALTFTDVSNNRFISSVRNDSAGITLADGSSVSGNGLSLPSGYTLKKKWDLTTKETGWTTTTGHTISRAYYTSSNVTWGSSGLRIRCSYNSSGAAGDSNWSSGQAIWAAGTGFVPDEHYLRFTAYQEQSLILGDFPSWVWSRAQTGDGTGEIDYHETMADHIAGVTVLDGGAGAANPTQLGNKVTMIRTPYTSGVQVNYSQGINEPLAGNTEVNFSSVPHTFEVFKTLTSMTTYIDGDLHTVHLRGGSGGTGYPSNSNTTAMTNAIWDSQFANGKLWDLRVCYQYGDWTKAMGAPADHSGNAGRAQPFTTDRYMRLTDLLVAVPV